MNWFHWLALGIFIGLWVGIGGCLLIDMFKKISVNLRRKE